VKRVYILILLLPSKYAAGCKLSADAAKLINLTALQCTIMNMPPRGSSLIVFIFLIIVCFAVGTIGMPRMKSNPIVALPPLRNGIENFTTTSSLHFLLQSPAMRARL
jgi:hypothetical protein